VGCFASLRPLRAFASDSAVLPGRIGCAARYPHLKMRAIVIGSRWDQAAAPKALGKVLRLLVARFTARIVRGIPTPDGFKTGFTMHPGGGGAKMAVDIERFSDRIVQVKGEAWNMVSIVSSYPGFHSLPRGIKQLLLASESNFFEEAKPLASGGPGKSVSGVGPERPIGG